MSGLRAIVSLLAGAVLLSPAVALADPTSPEDLALAAAPLAPEEQGDKKEGSRCGETHRLYVRRDDLDLSSYTGNVSKKDAKGASLSAWRDDETGTDQLEVHGVITWVASQCLPHPGGLSAYVSSRSFAPFLALDGVRADDPDDDKSTVRVGVAFQATVFQGRFGLQAFTFAPYFESDFRGEARAAGAALGWEPYKFHWHLGGAKRPYPTSPVAYWTLKLDADWLEVDKGGRTGLKDGTGYLWVGGHAGVVAFPPMPKGWEGRLKLYGDVDLHHDARNKTEARMLTVGAALNLDEDGAVSLSLERNWGEDRKTLRQESKTSFALNFKL